MSVSILNTLKNIASKAKRRFFGASTHSKRDDSISSQEASDIQKEAYIKGMKRAYKPERTPPYLELSAQLLADEPQIFQAAVDHLASIATARKKYASEIKAIFAEVIAGRKLSEEKSEYIKRKLEEI